MKHKEEEEEYYKVEREFIENDMLRMASGMKQFAISFKE